MLVVILTKGYNIFNKYPSVKTEGNSKAISISFSLKSKSPKRATFYVYPCLPACRKRSNTNPE